MKLYFFSLVGIAACAHGAPGTPKVLIVPIARGNTQGPPVDSIGNYLAQEFDQEGRVRPIVWSSTDPTFRDSVANGIIRVTKNYPTKAEAVRAGKLLGAVYVFLYSATGAAKGFDARAELFQNGRAIWQDSQNSGTQRSGTFNTEDSNKSIAHTWTLRLANTAFKVLTLHPKVATPLPASGTAPPTTLPVPTAPTGPAPTIATHAAEFVKNGHADKAISLVRDAIDANPFSAELRILLVNLYEQQKDWSAAAEAARLGSEVIPDNIALRKTSLKDLLFAGKEKEAHDQLNEILARDPNSPDTLLLESQTYLAVGDYEKATLALDKMVKRAPTTDGYYWRALARCALGGVDGVNADVQEYLKKPMLAADVLSNSEETEKILARITTRDLDLTLALFPQASLHPDSSDVRDQIDQLVSRATARAAFLQQIPSAPMWKQCCGQLLLAQKLLIASLASLRDATKGGGEDGMTDARINLGEAIKALKNSQKLQAREE